MAFAVSDLADCTFEVIVPVFILFLLFLHLAGHSRYMEKSTIKYSSFSFSTTARSVSWLTFQAEYLQNSIMFFVYIFYDFFSPIVVVRFSCL